MKHQERLENVGELMVFYYESYTTSLLSNNRKTWTDIEEKC